MAAPVGNKNAEGKKTGRKSAFDEKQDADFISDIYYNKQNLAKLQKKIESGNYSIKDMIKLKALLGNDKILTAILNKIAPDLTRDLGDKDKLEAMRKVVEGWIK